MRGRETRWPLCLFECVIREYVQFLNKQVISEKGSRIPEKGKSDGLKDPVRQGRMVVKPKAALDFPSSEGSHGPKETQKVRTGA